MDRQRHIVRGGFGLHFAAGFAGVVVVVANAVAGFQPDYEIWLSAVLIVILILHVRLGFALRTASREIEMLSRLAQRVDPPAPPDPSFNVAEQDVRPEDIAVLRRVKSAIESDRIDLYLQPIVSLPQRKPRFYEAFSRMRDEQGRVLKPAEYLEAAERTNRVGVIDNMILLRCVQALRRHSQRVPRLVFFCNLSPATLYDREFFRSFTDYLEQNVDLASNLVFEMTCPAVQMMHPRVEKNLAEIARRGFAFSIDHVQSLDLDWAALRARNFSFVKAPASLLLAAASGDETAVQRLATFRKRLSDAGLDLIAEKIELETHMPEILSLGLDFGQGNLFGPARPAEFYLGFEREEYEPAPLAVAS